LNIEIVRWHASGWEGSQVRTVGWHPFRPYQSQSNSRDFVEAPTTSRKPS